MTLTIEQTDAAILSTFNSMEEGVKYVLNDFWFAEINRIRNQHSCDLIKDKKEYTFSRKSEKLFVNGKEVIDFSNKTNLTFALPLAFILTFSFIAPFAITVAFILQNNGLEKLSPGCEDKIVEIDGKKYKLVAV